MYSNTGKWLALACCLEPCGKVRILACDVGQIDEPRGRLVILACECVIK